MSVIRAIVSGGAPVPYTGDQAGLNLAISDLTASGGIIEVGPGLEALTITPPLPSGIAILWFRNDGKVQFYDGAFELYDRTSGLFALKASSGGLTCGQPGTGYVVTFGQGTTGADGTTVKARSGNSGGTSASFSLNRNGTDFSSWLFNGTDTFLDWTGLLRFRLGISGTEKMSLSTSRLDLKTGVDLAFNGSPGTAGVSVPISGGAGVNPSWGTPAGIPGSAMTVMLHAQLWGSGVNTATPGTGVYVYNSMANADVSNYMTFTLPLAYTATTTWKVFWTPTGGAGTTVTHGIGMFKHTAGMDFSTATFTMGAEVTSNSPAADILQIDTVPTPALSLAAGDTVTLRLRRRGDTDSSTFSSRFIGLLLSYT